MIGQNLPPGCPFCGLKRPAGASTLVSVPNLETVMSYTYRETALNWLALGLLLAAWNAADDAVPAAAKPPQRPAALRAHAQMSVRAVTRAAVVQRGFTVL